MLRRSSAARLLVSFFLVAAAGCGDDDAGPAAQPTASTTTGIPADTPVLGFWHRAQSCQEMRTAFEEAGLVESHRDWMQGNFYGGEPGPATGDPCAGAAGPLEHDHFFTAAGGFGSHDESGEEVDGGDFAVVDGDTLTFPSHAKEFRYEGDVLVDYSISGDIATFEVQMPDTCADTCADAYAWALSAFASGPWQRGEVP